MEQYGNQTTYNLETVLMQNIKRSLYWNKRAKDIADWSELVDEIYETVDNVEPWMSGNARGPSTAFNLLYRLGQLKPTVEQIGQMLDHGDSPFIRAVGFLYLRYVCDPRQLWDWCRNYLRDEEEFEPSPPGLGHAVTIGDFVRDILLDQFYFETLFPRVPKTVTDEICAQLKDMGLPTKAKGNAGQGGADRRGVNEGTARPASVKASLSVAFGQRAPNRAGAREQGRGMGADLPVPDRAVSKRSPSPHKREERPASRDDRRRDDRGGKDRERRQDEGRRDEGRVRDDRRQRSRSRDRGGDYGGRREREQRDYDRRDNRDRGGYGREREHGGQRDDNRDRRGDRYERRDDRRGEYERRDDRRGEYERRRSRERVRSESRDARDVFQDRAAAPHRDADKLREAYG